MIIFMRFCYFYVALLYNIMMTFSPLQAQEIKQIKTKAIGTTFFHAQNIAITHAERQALTQLMKEKDPTFPLADIQNLSQSTMIDMISSYKIYDEKPGPHFYEATIDITFNAKKIASFVESLERASYFVPYHTHLITPVCSQRDFLWCEAWNASLIYLYSFLEQKTGLPLETTIGVTVKKDTPPAYHVVFGEKKLLFPVLEDEESHVAYQRIATFLIVHFLPFLPNKQLIHREMEWHLLYNNSEEWAYLQKTLNHFSYLFHWKVKKFDSQSATLTVITPGDITKFFSLFEPYHLIFTFKGTAACLTPKNMTQPCYLE